MFSHSLKRLERDFFKGKRKHFRVKAIPKISDDIQFSNCL